MRNREMQRGLKQKQLHILEAAWTYLYEFVAIVQHFFSKKCPSHEKNLLVRLSRLPILMVSAS